MTPLSDRQHDAFDNPAKAACRDGNLRAMRKAAYPTRYRAGKMNPEYGVERFAAWPPSLLDTNGEPCRPSPSRKLKPTCPN